MSLGKTSIFSSGATLFTIGRILVLVSFVGTVYFLASAGANVTLDLTLAGISVVGIGIGGLLVAISDRRTD
jgi:hypothetical protein